MPHNDTIHLSTKGFCDVINITDQVEKMVKKSDVKDGLACIFVTGSTAGVTTIEYEPGVVKDFQELMEKLVPQDREYHHNERWGDARPQRLDYARRSDGGRGNGFSHVRASLIGGSFTVPVVNGQLTLGAWQQIVIVDFDNRERDREVVVQVVGE